MDLCGTPQVTFIHSELVSLIQTYWLLYIIITTDPLISNTSYTIVITFLCEYHGKQYQTEPESIPLRNWSFLLIPCPIPELELEVNWLNPARAECELNWNCHTLNWNWSRNCILRNWIRNCLPWNWNPIWGPSYISGLLQCYSYIEKANTSCLHITGPN